jgi:thiol-disulfide isomerase/thioredoxin
MLSTPLPEFPPNAPDMLVACLCADWCGACREYQPLFAQMQKEYPAAKLMWIDIEDQADLVDPIEVDNFPTLLIAVQGHAKFYGTVTPHMDTLRRLFQSYAENPDLPEVTLLEVQALVQRLLRQEIL